MDDINLFAPKAAAAIHALLPGRSWREANAQEGAPHVTVADWQHVRATIGTPAALDEAMAPLAQDVEARLPAAWSSVLMTTITLYALAVDFFDTEEQARQWWNSPVPVVHGGQKCTPRDWAGQPGGASRIAELIRRTQHGIF